MKVCQVSTYLPTRCGIATYTRALAQAISGQPGIDMAVLAEVGAMSGLDGDVLSLPVFDRAKPWIDSITAAAVARQADVVHIQHAHDIMGIDDRLPELCRQLAERGIPSATTLHSVYTRRSGLYQRKLGVVRFHRELAKYSHLVVHQREGMHDALREQGIPEAQISVIPHGTDVRPNLDQAAARGRLGLPAEGAVLLCFGFIHMLKNLHTPIKAMALLRDEFPDARLVIAGSVQKSRWYNLAYLRYLKHLVDRFGLESRVELRHGYVPDDDIEDYYAASDLVLLSHAQRYGSASGVAHLALATGTPVVFSDSPKFAELAGKLGKELQVTGGTPEEWAACIRALLRDDAALDRLKTRTAELASETSWDGVAAQTVAMYRQLIQARGARGADSSARA